jgi:hypothetical protein
MTHKRIWLIFVFVSQLTVGFAQPGGGPGGGGNPGHGKPVPISGIELLLAAGALLGTKRLIELRKRREAD